MQDSQELKLAKRCLIGALQSRNCEREYAERIPDTVKRALLYAHKVNIEKLEKSLTRM